MVPEAEGIFCKGERLLSSVLQDSVVRQVMLKVRGLIVILDDFINPMGKKQEAQVQEQFGKRVRELRKDRGLSQEALALACELDRTYIGSVERGERNISLLNIHKLAGALGVQAKDLLDV